MSNGGTAEPAVHSANIVDGSAAPVAVDSEFAASLYSNVTPLPREFAKLIRDLEKKLEMPIWLLVQTDRGPWGDINEQIYEAFHKEKGQIATNKPVGLLLHSPGGQADEAYKIVRLFQRRTDQLTTIVPCYAKSASTLMALGGKEILMGGEAELGPLDVQIYDSDNYEYDSALNAVQSLERLNAYALSALDQMMLLLMGRTGKKPDSVLPMAMEYATSMMRPLVEKIDSINLTKKSRDLKVAEDYCIRLMRTIYGHATAKRIANALVERYSTHGFVIDREESSAHEKSGADDFGLGLKIKEPDAEVEGIFDALRPFLQKHTVIGRVKERSI